MPHGLPRVSVVIPTLFEADSIGDCLRSLASEEPEEVIVSDASSPDGTAERARSLGARVIESSRGRGVQQNRGAEVSTGDILLFMHADCRLDAGSIDLLRRFLLRNRRVPGGCFRMRVDARDLRFRAIDAAAHLRAGVLGFPYGDQGIFVARWAFERVGGFPEIPLMEDVFLGRALRRLGRLALLPCRIHVSPRRWRKYGIVGQSLRNWGLTAAAAAGVDPSVLARFYPVVR